MGRKETNQTHKQTTVLRHMFEDHLNSNHFNPIIGDQVKSVTACQNGVKGPILNQLHSGGRDKGTCAIPIYS